MSTEAQESGKLTPAKAAAKRAQFERLALLLLPLATVGTPWCSFQTPWIRRAALALGLDALAFAAQRLMFLPVPTWNSQKKL